MYAISFDLDTKSLQELYPSTATASWQNAYTDIRKELIKFGFEWQQGSVYFADINSKKVNAVQCVLASQHLSKMFNWFKGSVRDIRMLRIEELNDLSPAVNAI